MGDVWRHLGCALLGIILTLIDFEKFKVMEMVLYIAIGWTLLFVVKPLFHALSTAGVVLVILGGAVYTVGAIIYGFGKKVKYFHALFHIFVLAGSTLHFVAVYWYVRRWRNKQSEDFYNNISFISF